MATSSPFRTDKELYASAALVGPVMSRSAAQQITHWARIGRELEEGGAFSTEVAEVLAGARSYDDLTDREQAVVRAEWEVRIAERIATLDLVSEFEAAGRPYSYLNSEGEIVTWRPNAAEPA